MTYRYDIAIVGGGIVGCSILSALAQKGVSNAVLLERLDLTSGSTWHSAGNTTHFGHYSDITKLYADSLEFYLATEKATGNPIDFHRTGSLRLATSQKQLAEYESLKRTFAKLGVPFSVIDGRDAGQRHPLLDSRGIFGAAYTPADGHVDPSLTTRALAKIATICGAKIERNCLVADFRKNGTNWELDTTSGTVSARHLVLAASFWTRELAMKADIDLPLFAVEHQALITDDIPELISREDEVPAVRDPAAPCNIRQEGNALLVGVYEREPKFWGTEGIPSDFGQDLFPPDLDRLEIHLSRAIERMPVLGRCGIKTVINGPICFTPDGYPLLGHVDGKHGLWLAAGFQVGVGTGGGSGQYLANWIINGKPPYPLPAVYPSRFRSPLDKSECLRRIKAAYSGSYVGASHRG
ncbi:MAG: FAD-binding oxidoreductase [Albidovulum sp.]|nr:FAD-binding oxidoreductase [Albidovulum sp.]